MPRLLRIGLAMLVGGLVAGGGALVLGWIVLERWLHSPGPLEAPVTVVLPRGIGLAGIAEQLTAAGVIDQPQRLVLAARIAGRDRTLKAGEYAFVPGMTPDMVLRLLEQGAVVLHPVTVAEGLTVTEVFALLAASPVLSGPLPPLPPEGSLLPETYLVPRDEPRARLVSRMRADMAAALERAWANRQPNLPLTSPEEALILASIIEKETAVAAEYPLVAAVFVNRLRKGMPLQTDPTVIYALTRGDGPLGRALTRRDLEVDHPYNTYRNPGLPPGPIANPGRAALEAAVRPADVDYLYFVADGTGGHAFARTLAEHNRNVARWRAVRDAGG
jgi:UPF0755 protein